MRLKMSTPARVELVESLRTAYSLEDHAGKRRILDQIVTATGYNRKHAICLLNGDKPLAVATRKRSKHYDEAFEAVLFELWLASNRVCGKRLVALLDKLIPALERHDRLSLTDSMRAELLAVSASTVDRLLAPRKKELAYSGRKRRVGNTHTLNIPVRTGPWTDAKVGFCEVDLVAHGGGSTSGSFLHTLTVTDIASGWTETEALLNRSAEEVLRALKLIRERFPVPLLGIDSDNGTEFINELLEPYCREQNIVFTRSRPYEKNDQAHVEQKNGALVRKLVGYARFEGDKARASLSALYTVSRLHVNFLQCSAKLQKKERFGSKVRKWHDKPKTPYERLLASGCLSDAQQTRMHDQFMTLDPVLLLKDIERLQNQLWALSPQTTNTGTEAVIPPKLTQRKKARRPSKPKPLPHKNPGRKRIDWFDEEIHRLLDANPAMKSGPLYRILEGRYGTDIPSYGTIIKRMNDWRSDHPEYADQYPKKFGQTHTRNQSPRVTFYVRQPVLSGLES